MHRDLKPQNLFLEGGAIDRVQVLDFGIAEVGATTSPFDVSTTGRGYAIFFNTTGRTFRS